jgi:hypothetical protein
MSKVLCSLYEYQKLRCSSDEGTNVASDEGTNVSSDEHYKYDEVDMIHALQECGIEGGES